MATIIERFADYSFSLSAAHFPEALIQSAVEAVIDTVGCGIAGSQTTVAEGVRRAMHIPVGPERSTLFGGQETGTLASAAFINATAAHALELDDTDAKGFCHPGAVVVPAALAVGETTSASGIEVLTAIIIGYEVSVRLARWMNPAHRLRGFHTTATVPTVGAAATVARLRGMSSKDTASAMGIAASFASGTFEFVTSGSNLKRVHAGKAASSAITSCDLAQHGVNGPLTALEGKYGLYASTAGEIQELLNLTDLGERFMIQEVGRKLYPCCRFCHTAIDAAIGLHESGISLRDAERIEVIASRLCCEQTDSKTPANELQRQFSTPYGVALGLLRGAARLSDYRENPDAEALELAQKVEMIIDSDLPVGDRAATVRISSGSNRIQQVRLDGPRGEPNDPINGVELREKFADLAASALPMAAVLELYELLSNLLTLTDMTDIYGLLRFNAEH
jgi:2-methylcitrate dehydratase PrpD